MAKPHAFNAAAADSAARRKLTTPPPTAGLPTSSWWTQARTREEFAVLARDQVPRMKESALANAAALIFAKDTKRAKTAPVRAFDGLE